MALVHAFRQTRFGQTYSQQCVDHASDRRNKQLTAQEAEILINESDVDLGRLKPYFVLRADHSDAYPISPNVHEFSARCSSNWNGYIATMRLHSDYRLELEQFDFPYARDLETQKCNAYFEGDFSIIFRPFFTGPNTTIPFRDGRIVCNQNEWQVDDQTMNGVVLHAFRSRDSHKYIGVLVDIGFTAFAPKSLLPNSMRDDLVSLVGKSVKCHIFEIDEQRGNVILRIEAVEDA